MAIDRITLVLGAATILVVDDDPVYGEVLTDLLRGEGHSVHHELDGEAAIRCIRRMGERLDLVVCDLLLPKKTGFEVVKEINTLELSLPVLAMTGVYENSREVNALRGMGVAGYVHKSTSLEQFLFRVNCVLFPYRDEVRVNPRVSVSVPVQFRLNEAVSYGTSYNLSICGVYVRTHEPVLAGSAVDITLRLPTAREMLQAEAEIVHSATPTEVQGTAYPAGFGARFTKLSGLVKSALRAFVETVHREETLGEHLGSPRFTIVEDTEDVPVP